MDKQITIEPLTNKLNNRVLIPGSKSHTNRALICASLSDGISNLTGLLKADDTLAMMESLKSLGVRFDSDAATLSMQIQGLGSFPKTNKIIEVDSRQSGTTSRFILPILAAGLGEFLLDGHEQLRSRPIDELVLALNSIGANISGLNLPLKFKANGISGSSISISGSTSSQYLSGLMLIGPMLDNGLAINVKGDLVSKPYVDLTAHTMRQFGAEITIDPNYKSINIQNTKYKPSSFMIEPDASAASYFFAMAAISGGTIEIEGLGSETIQGDLRFVDLLSAMGAEITMTRQSTKVTGPKKLKGIKVDMSDISDTAQTLAMVACFAETPTEITGIGFIRKKETNRIKAVVDQLNNLGINASETDDGMIINPGVVKSGAVETYDDHRMAMSFSILGLFNKGIEILNPGCVNKTFPNFFKTLDAIRA